MESKTGNNSTSSSWIKKEQPTGISSHALYKDGYKDILEERRGEMDFAFALKNRDNIPVYKYNRPRDYEVLKRDVLNSDRVKYTVEKLSLGDKVKEDAMKKEAEEIYKGMAHLLSLRGVRVMAFLLIKVFKSLFRRVYVNEEGVHRLHQLMQEYPVILMPSHRSYMDFLLVSYVCYHYDLPIPAIAAAMDFKGMKFMGWLLQNCGAFYIRRSFGSDHLYWAVFTEYVQTQLRNGDQPLEFFVEGTRSRTNKSYTPKTGMLAASLESYFKAELPDTMIVPISVTYDRVLEETLYSYELLGIPKPKESTSSLLKARSILDEDFGSVHVHFGEPISIRQFSVDRIDRVVHSLEPRYINNLTPKEKLLIRDLAFSIVKNQQSRFVVPPGTLLAAVMMQHRGGLHIDELARKVDWLKMQACNMGAYVDWPGNLALREVMEMCIKFHKNILVDRDGIIQLRLQPATTKKRALPSSSSSSTSSSSLSPQRAQLMSDAAANLLLASYRNHVLHLFVNVAMVMLSVRSKLGRVSEVIAEDIFPSYSFLEGLLSKDFVFQSGQTEQAFRQAVLQLKNSGILVVKCVSIKHPKSVQPSVEEASSDSIDGDQFLVERSMNEQSLFFCKMFEPFLVAYWVACHYLSTRSADKFGRPLAKRQKDLASEIQSSALALVETGATNHHEILSLDLINNTMSSFIELKALTKDRRNDETWLSPNQVVVQMMRKQIEEFVDVPSVSNSLVKPLRSRL